ncbi:RidA family protein [Luteimonas abyssi]|uniref:RidA family protein n=1 Tax=Luteimonas abyssi TaxID=1247514 RepID=UPI000737CA64|nr:RidA family protein [Luteimonas abyssi]
MSRVIARLAELGLQLPPPLVAPPGVVLPFAFAQRVGSRVLIAGHGPQGPDGRLVGPFGKVGAEVEPDAARHAAMLTGLSMLASVQAEIGDLDRITGWRRVFGMVASAPDFHGQPEVINGFSDLIHAVFGPVTGRHVRSAVGMAVLPWNIPVEIEGELAIDGGD